MQGILLVDKPSAWTSFDVVAYVRKIIASEQKVKPAQIKVGHTGTLDPLATGLLVLLIGKPYTRLATELTKLDKEYLVEMKLGEITESGDSETEVKAYSSYAPTKDEVARALKSFEGESMQLPPVYSAIKVNGQRAYDLARQGKAVELKARPVTIYDIQLTQYDYPMLKFSTRVSSGTYIRSLVVDLGEKLKSGAYMTELRRTSVGDFSLNDSLKVDDLNYDKLAQHLLFV
ncbi:MAG TPA: tRNA pseudouridine(55) synthase TruB [Candidatus Saccharimonadales bacterium]|jgi:tRNA pseudouridine55 synthase